MRRSTTAVAAAAAVALSSWGVAAAAAPGEPSEEWQPYRLTVLQPLEQGNASFALGVNDRGQVAGTARTSTSTRPQLATVWDGGAGRSLGTVSGSTFSRAFDVNSGGLSVGEAFTPSPETSKAVAWTPEGDLVEVGSLNADGTGVANDVNDRGRVVGVSHNGQYVRGFAGRVGAVRELPVPAAEGPVTTTRANAISEDGAVAGVSYVTHVHGDHTHNLAQATVWDGWDVDLLAGTGEDRPAIAYGVNDSGLVAGEESDGTDWRAILWEAGSPTVLPGVSGLRHARASAVNENGDVVGHASGFYGFPTIDGRALLWRGGVAHDLNEMVELAPGQVLRSANDVSSTGEIVGTMSTPDGTRGFLLEPNPPAPSHLHTEELVTGPYGAPIPIAFEVHTGGEPTGDVAVVVDGRRVAETEVQPDGTGVVTVPGTYRPGRYDAELVYSGNETAAGSSEHLVVDVTRATPQLSVITEVTGRRPTFDVTARTAQGGTPLPGRVAVRVHGEGREVTGLGRDGHAEVAWSRLPAGRYRVTVTYLSGTYAEQGSTRTAFRVG